MEKGTLIGLCIAIVGVFGSAVLHGINIVFLFMEIGSILIVFAGCIGATMIAFPMEATSNVVEVLPEGDEGRRGALGDGDDRSDRQAHEPRPLRGSARPRGRGQVDRRPVLPQGHRVRRRRHRPRSVEEDAALRDQRDEGTAQGRSGLVHPGRCVRADVRHHRCGVRSDGDDGVTSTLRPRSVTVLPARSSRRSGACSLRTPCSCRWRTS